MPHVARIRYVPGSLTVFLDNLTDPVLTVPVELSSALDLDGGRAWVGFTAARFIGGSPCDILSWDFCPLAASAGQADRPDGRRPQGEAAASPKPGITEQDLPFLEKALAFYSALARQNPDDPAVQLATAKAAWRVGEIRLKLGLGEEALKGYGEALQSWEKLATDLPHVSDYGEHLVRGYDRRAWVLEHQLRRYDEALADLTRWLELRPRDAGAYRRRAALYTELKQDRRADGDLSMANRINPNGADWHHDRGHRYWKAGQHAKAAAEFSRAIELRPSNAHILGHRGHVHFELEQYDKAVADLSRAVNLDASDANAWNNRAAVFGRLGRLDEAVADYSKAIELAPGNAVYWGNRGYSYMKLSAFSKAAVDYSKAIELKPEEDKYWSSRGHAHAQCGRWDAATADFTRAIELNSEVAHYSFCHAMAELASGNIGGYVEACRRMTQRFADMSGASATWTAWACAVAPGAITDAAQTVRLAEVTAGFDEVHHGYLLILGAALYRAGRFDEALARLRKAHGVWDAADPKPRSFSPAYTWLFLAMAHQRRGNAQEARRWLDRAAQWTDNILQEGTLANGTPLPWCRRLTLELLRREAEGGQAQLRGEVAHPTLE